MKHIRTISMLVLSSMLITSLAGCSSNKQSMEEIIATAESAIATPTPVPGNPEQAIITSGDLVFKKITDDYYQVNDEVKAFVWLKYNYQPNDVNIAVEEWSSSDETVATVSDDGKLTPVGLGECEITLHISDGLTNGTTTSISVTVEDGIIELEDQDLPSFSELKRICKDSYGDIFSEYDDSIDNALSWDEDTPFINLGNNTTDFYKDYSTVEKLIFNSGKFVICHCGDSVVFITGSSYAVLCDEYLFYYFGCDTPGIPIDYDDLIDIHDKTGLPIPDEEAVSELFD